MKSTIVRRNAWEINTSFYFLSSCSDAHRLIQQQIARYFSRLSAVTKRGLLMRSSSVNMNEDGEADADDLASEFEIDRTRQKIRRDLSKFR